MSRQADENVTEFLQAMIPEIEKIQEIAKAYGITDVIGITTRADGFVYAECDRNHGLTRLDSGCKYRIRTEKELDLEFVENDEKTA